MRIDSVKRFSIPSTHLWSMLPSYENLYINLERTQIYWSLSGGNIVFNGQGVPPQSMIDLVSLGSSSKNSKFPNFREFPKRLYLE